MTTVLLDANNLAMRSYHAAKYSMTTDDGIETGSLHIFVRSLSKLLDAARPDRLVVVWDGGGSTYRLGLYPQYKEARRAEHSGPAPHATTFALIQEFLRLTGFEQWRESGVEADDLIAQAVLNEAERDLSDIIIMSSDKDLLQCLVKPNVVQWRFTSDGPEVWTRDRVQADLGYSVETIPYVMALTGDSSDSIPGGRGLGPKRALKIIDEAFIGANGVVSRGSWVDTYDYLIRKRPDYEMIRLSYRLVKLPAPGVVVPPVPEFRPLSMASPEAQWRAVADFCIRYQLRVIWTELEAGTLLAQGRLV